MSKMGALDERTLRDAAALSSATLHEAAGKIGALPAVIKPLAPSMKVCGRAFPVRSPGGDNLFIHHAIYTAHPGDVLVVDTGAAREFGYWGDVMTSAAQIRGLAGLVITGGVRDSQQLRAMQFPVFAAAICIRGTDKDPHGDGSVGTAVRIGDVTIEAGDLVVGDADGVVSVPAAEAAAVIVKAQQRDRDEDRILERLRGGETTLDIYRLPDIVSVADPTAPRRARRGTP